MIKGLDMNEKSIKLQNEILVLKDIRSWQQELIRGLLRTLAIASSLLLIVILYDSYLDRAWGSGMFYGGIYAVLVLVAFWSRIPYNLQVLSLLIIFYGLGVQDLTQYGLAGDGRMLLLPFPLLATVFFERRKGILALGLAALTMAVMGYMFAAERIVIPVEVRTTSDILINWSSSTVALTTAGTVLVISPSFLMRRLTATLAQSRELVRELEQRMATEQEQHDRLQQAHREIEERVQVEQEQREHLQRVITQVREAVDNLGLASSGILATTTQQASGAHEQSAAITQTTTTVDELKTIAEQSVTRAQQVEGASQRTVEVSRSGQQAVQQTIASMVQIKTRVEGVAQNILALAEQTQHIGEIITTVGDIAAQSNMLALNASVEAARAGEHGKGFAVVAVEVRNLAEQSRQATAQVKTILTDIQKAMNATVMAIEQGAKGVDEGVRLAAQAQASIEQLSTVIKESAQAATQMVVGGRQQAFGVEQVVLAMRDIDHATRQSLDGTREAERHAQELDVLARNLAEVVEQ